MEQKTLFPGFGSQDSARFSAPSSTAPDVTWLSLLMNPEEADEDRSKDKVRDAVSVDERRSTRWHRKSSASTYWGEKGGVRRADGVLEQPSPPRVPVRVSPSTGKPGMFVDAPRRIIAVHRLTISEAKEARG